MKTKIKAPKKTPTFIATQYRDKPIRVYFYTESRGRIKFTGTGKAPVKARIKSKVRK